MAKPRTRSNNLAFLEGGESLQKYADHHTGVSASPNVMRTSDRGSKKFFGDPNRRVGYNRDLRNKRHG